MLERSVVVRAAVERVRYGLGLRARFTKGKVNRVAQRVAGEGANHGAQGERAPLSLQSYTLGGPFKNGVKRSIGTGRKVVVLCSLEISRMVCRKRS